MVAEDPRKDRFDVARVTSQIEGGAELFST